MQPIKAIQSVTLNPASYSGLEQEIGGIAPGRWADIALLEDLEQCRVRQVLVKGQTVAREGQSLVDQTPTELPAEMFRSLRLRPSVSPGMLKISSRGRASKVRVMVLVSQTITAERILELQAAGGALAADLDQDLLKVVMFDRHHGNGKIALGFLQGFGARVGAVGLTTNLDENTLMIVGSDDDDMATCANALIEAGGGIAIVHRGDLLEKLTFPFGGVFSLEPWPAVGKGLRRVQNRLKEMGSSFDKPMFALIFLPFVTLPALRITSRGLINVKDRKIVPLVVGEGS
jgi:adenine deaminase